MKATALNTAPEYYHSYIQLVEEKPLLDMLDDGGIAPYIEAFEELKAYGLKTYAPGKWTINEIVQHVMDTERVMIYRALRFARQDKVELAGYDHDAYVPVSRANEQSLEDLLKEYRILRLSSYYFFKNLNEEQLLRTGIANGVEISVLALGYVLIGHPLHHFNVIRERYLGGQ